MKVSLVVLNAGKSAGHTIPVTLPQFSIGRDPQCNLRPASPIISKRHCAVLIKDGNVSLRDFESTNGTFVNDDQIHGEVPLQDEDVVKIGPLTFKVVIERTPVDKPTPLPSKKTLTGKADDVAGMLLSLPDSTGVDPASEVPAGSTLMEVMTLPTDPEDHTAYPNAHGQRGRGSVPYPPRTQESAVAYPPRSSDTPIPFAQMSLEPHPSYAQVPQQPANPYMQMPQQPGPYPQSPQQPPNPYPQMPQQAAGHYPPMPPSGPLQPVSQQVAGPYPPMSQQAPPQVPPPSGPYPQMPQQLAVPYPQMAPQSAPYPQMPQQQGPGPYPQMPQPGAAPYAAPPPQQQPAFSYAQMPQQPGAGYPQMPQQQGPIQYVPIVQVVPQGSPMQAPGLQTAPMPDSIAAAQPAASEAPPAAAESTPAAAADDDAELITAEYDEETVAEEAPAEQTVADQPVAAETSAEQPAAQPSAAEQKKEDAKKASGLARDAAKNILEKYTKRNRGGGK